MDPFAYLLAATLIANPNVNWEIRVIVETPATAKDPSSQYTIRIRTTDPQPWHEFSAAEMQVLCVLWEILDIRECKHILTEPGEFFQDLRLLQKRFVDLADAPPLVDSKRFPCRDDVNELLTFNRNYRQFLETRLILDQVHSDQIKAALKETDNLYHVWDIVRNARCGYYYITVRREALQQLRSLLGANAYYSGHLPPHVPIWRIPRK